LPELRFSMNFNKLDFADTTTIRVARNQFNIQNDIGWDISGAIIYRPFFSQNIVMRLSAATLIPGEGFKDLYGDEKAYSVLANILLAY